MLTVFSDIYILAWGTQERYFLESSGNAYFLSSSKNANAENPIAIIVSFTTSVNITTALNKRILNMHLDGTSSFLKNI